MHSILNNNNNNNNNNNSSSYRDTRSITYPVYSVVAWNSKKGDLRVTTTKP